jgi:hypothetical protein
MQADHHKPTTKTPLEDVASRLIALLKPAVKAFPVLKLVGVPTQSKPGSSSFQRCMPRWAEEEYKITDCVMHEQSLLCSKCSREFVGFSLNI